MRTLCFLAVLGTSCENYKPEPYVEVSHRDETIGTLPYAGNELRIGVTFRHSPAPVAERITLPHLDVHPVHPVESEPDDYAEEIEAFGAWPWFAWIGSALLVFALAVALWAWRRKHTNPDDKRETDG